MGRRLGRRQVQKKHWEEYRDRARRIEAGEVKALLWTRLNRVCPARVQGGMIYIDDNGTSRVVSVRALAGFESCEATSLEKPKDITPQHVLWADQF